MPYTLVPAEHLERLLLQIAEGNDLAFRELYLLSKARLATYARRIVRCDSLLEDILQEGFLAIWHGARHFDSQRAAPMTWMAAIFRNKAIDHVRADRLRRICQTDGDADENHEWECTMIGPDLVVERDQQVQIIIHGLSFLEAQQRQAIELAFFHDLSYPEAAREMMIPLGTAKTWIRRGCISLRTKCRRSEKATESTARASMGRP